MVLIEKILMPMAYGDSFIALNFVYEQFENIFRKFPEWCCYMLASTVFIVFGLSNLNLHFLQSRVDKFSKVSAKRISLVRFQ